MIAGGLLDKDLIYGVQGILKDFLKLDKQVTKDLTQHLRDTSVYLAASRTWEGSAFPSTATAHSLSPPDPATTRV